MIPHTFPTVLVSGTNATEMVVFELASAGDLVAWEDYIPVKLVSADVSVANTYDNNGAMEVSILASASGMEAGVDYINVLSAPSATTAWYVGADGYIPIRDGK